MKKNKLMIAAAGSGKTTLLANEAQKIEEKNVLITTYTEANEAEIRTKIIKERGYIPKNITIQTWFSFLLQHGVRPYQSIMNDELQESKISFHLTSEQSGYRYSNKQGQPVYWGEKDFFRYYFTKNLRIYSDKISKFIIEANKKTKGEVINRISRIYPYILIDEVQDLAGWDLEIVKSLLNAPSIVLMVGDPRQVTYLTNHSRKYKKYIDGNIKGFLKNECKEDICDIDEKTLLKSHRNSKLICSFSSAIYPEFAACKPCGCKKCREQTPDHQGVFLIKNGCVSEYCKNYNPQILRYQKAEFPDLNYGISKGLSFDRVLIYPTEKIRNYLKNGDVSKIDSIKAKFYVATTRARHSVGIVCDYDDTNYIEGLSKY
jgi:DNA helicase II / ATP-dependent DNA helicase PcrA